MLGADRRLGQDLFQPPNVKGWPGGEAWVTTNTLPLRHQFLNRVVRGAAMKAAMTDAGGGESMGVLLAVAPVTPPDTRARPSQRLALLLLDPAFQLK